MNGDVGVYIGIVNFFLPDDGFGEKPRLTVFIIL